MRFQGSPPSCISSRSVIVLRRGTRNRGRGVHGTRLCERCAIHKALWICPRPTLPGARRPGRGPTPLDIRLVPRLEPQDEPDDEREGDGEHREPIEELQQDAHRSRARRYRLPRHLTGCARCSTEARALPSQLLGVAVLLVMVASEAATATRTGRLPPCLLGLLAVTGVVVGLPRRPGALQLAGLACSEALRPGASSRSPGRASRPMPGRPGTGRAPISSWSRSSCSGGGRPRRASALACLLAGGGGRRRRVAAGRRPRPPAASSSTSASPSPRATSTRERGDVVARTVRLRRDGRIPARIPPCAAALGGATLLAGLALLGQSRGWVFALPLALLVLLVISPTGCGSRSVDPHRRRAAADPPDAAGRP